jgi:Di-haem oxidoreductase, putative peroxidase
MRLGFGAPLMLLVLVGVSIQSGGASPQAGQTVEAPRFWNDRELADWATPVAGLKVRPGHFSEREYYSAPNAEWVRTYPVYVAGREPVGYWDMLREKKPEPLIAPGARTSTDWTTAGKRVFEEMDLPAFRSTDPQIIAIARSAEEYARRGGRAQSDGRAFGLRWVPTSKGLALGVSDCSICHTRVMPDGTFLNGAPFNVELDGAIGELATRGTAVFFPGDSTTISTWRQYTVPWIGGDIHENLKSMPDSEIGALARAIPSGAFARFNGSPYYPSKVPDLIGIKDRKYIDHTGTHRLRGSSDVMRYAALVSCCDSAEFGSHRILTPAQRRVFYRMPDELLFALAQYLFALEPPVNPNANDARATTGRQVFEREGCAACHTPPLYTNNKLTLAQGFVMPADHPNRSDVMTVSVGTDPNLALKTRKGTGFYKVPSLKGVWYRPLFNHDGSVTTLEEWFDPARLRDDFVPSGFKGYKVTSRAVPGHPFGLKLTAEDKAALIAFLKAL